jgi:hypothetical protein
LEYVEQTIGPVAPERQVRFLQQIQRVLGEGSFVASYKFALLHALADLCVVHGDDTDSPLRLETRMISEAMIELYWRQTLPFASASDQTTQVLRQNAGRQAGIVKRLAEARESHGRSLQRLKTDREAWNRLVGHVDRIVRLMPLWRLQTVSGQPVEFLYANVGSGPIIELFPGVASCFRAFYQLITELIRAAWLRYIRTYNAASIGEASELSEFLFGSERSGLQRYPGLLTDLQEGRCFYCAVPLHKEIAVDHFVPWSRYPVDLGHNFVLAHAGCNGRKGDYLAAQDHLGHWLDRNRAYGDELGRRFNEIGAVHDLNASVRIAEWAYSQEARAGGRVWFRNRELVALSSSWTELFTGWLADSAA